MATPKTVKDSQLARKAWNRYEYMQLNGHADFQKRAKINEDFYLGAGRQWSPEDRAALAEMNKPALEQNIIFSTVNTVLGMQTQSRTDIALKPREASDQETADTLTKVLMYIVDQNGTPWKESQVFADGIIQSRGFFEVKLDFSDNFYGEIAVETLDPMDVLIDPEGREYDPDTWKDVVITKWVSLDDIKETYGTAKYRQVSKGFSDSIGPIDAFSGETHNTFASENNQSTARAYYRDKTGEEYTRVIERQFMKLSMRQFFYDPITGEIEEVASGLSTREVKRIAKETERELTKRLVKRIRWTVSTQDILLHDDWSPYEHYTVVPYFPYFRRGVTLGLVDNVISSQELLNKTASQILHIVNTTANSGWILEENSLSNMDVEDLEEEGGKTGLVLEVKSGKKDPTKIQPNTIPSGLKDIMNTSVEMVRLITGVSESFQGGRSNEVSGVAIQSRVQQAAGQLASPLDNLFRTRNLLAQRILKLLQTYYTEERSFLITNENPNDEPQQVTLNQEAEDGGVINDVGAGKYDIVISDVPTQITFENAQFAQAVEMRKFGIAIPDDELVLLSTLARKGEIAKKMSAELSEEEQAAQAEQQEIESAQLQAQIDKTVAETLSKQQEAAKKAAETALLIKDNEGLGAMVDTALAPKPVGEAAPLEQEDPLQLLEQGGGLAPEQGLDPLAGSDPLAGLEIPLPDGIIQ